MEVGMIAPQNVFDHYAQTLRRRKLKLADFNILSMEHQKSYFWFNRLSGATS